MSPEQALGEEVDGRSDVYSLGVVLFEMLTGRLPFEGRNATELIAKHISAPPKKVSELEPQTPAALVSLVDRMLAKSPSSRPDSTELVRLLTEASAPERLLSPRVVSRRRWRKRAGYIGVALTSAVLVIWGVVRVAGGIIGVLMEPGVDRAVISGPSGLMTYLARPRKLARRRLTLAFIPRCVSDAYLADDVLIRRSATASTD
jgi:serine/threonine-protein kinase